MCVLVVVWVHSSGGAQCSGSGESISVGVLGYGLLVRLGVTVTSICWGGGVSCCGGAGVSRVMPLKLSNSASDGRWMGDGWGLGDWGVQEVSSTSMFSYSSSADVVGGGE